MQPGETDELYNKIFQKSYQFLKREYDNELIILYTLCQLPGGALISDLKKMFEAFVPNWQEFLNVLVRFEPRGLKNVDETSKESHQEEDSNTDKSQASDGDIDTHWLVYSSTVDVVDQTSYSCDSIVYNFFNKNIITSLKQRKHLNLNVLSHLSSLSRKILRALKYSYPLLNSHFKFSAAIDIGIWSSTKKFSSTESFYKNYEDPMREPKLVWEFHENNFKQFLNPSYLESMIGSNSLRNKKETKNLKDLLLTIPTIEMF